MPLCRLSIQTDRNGQHVMVDMALPACTPVAALLPTIAELAGLPPRESAQCWRLARMSGSTLDESVTLADNDVHDGEILVLAPFDVAPLAPVRWDPCRTVADSASSADAPPFMPELACTWAAILGALALCAAVGHPGIRLLVAAIGTCTAAALAVTARSTTAGIASVCLAAATGFLAVPEGLAAANFFLAAAAAASMALLMIRWIDDSSSTLITTAAFSFLAAVAALPAMITGISVASAGAVVGVVALGLLAMSGRMSILLSGLVPDRHTDDHDERALRGYAVLSGLIGGCSAGAALGTVLVAVGCHRHGAPALAGAALGTVAGVALLLRIRTHLDATCRWALALGGIACVSAAFVVTVSAWPDQTAWAGAAVVAIGLGAIRTPKLTSGAVRAVELLEYATLVAVVPLACWVGGVYAMVRGTPLP